MTVAFPQLLFLLGGSTVICFSMASNSLDRGVGSKTPHSAHALVHVSYGWSSDQSQRGEERDRHATRMELQPQIRPQAAFSSEC